MQPAVSIILPVYNGSRYLRDSIESVLCQTFTHFEFVICDDGSLDDSREIIASYPDARIRFLQNGTNRGLFPTLNRLVDEAQGDLIRLWSQDDRMEVNCLDVEVDFWQRHPALGMCYCGWEVIGASGEPIASPKNDETPEVIEPWLANQISFYYGCMPGNIATVSVRKSVLREIGPFAPLRIAGDFEMWARIFETYSIGRVPSPLVKLRSHAGQYSRWTDSGVYWMKECEPIHRQLARWFPAELQGHVSRYRDRRTRVQYFHHAVKAVLGFRFGIAWQTMMFLLQVSNPLVLGWWWLISLNGRYFRVPAICRKPTTPREGAQFALVSDGGVGLEPRGNDLGDLR
jgi:glycosyltransferase involved in cell wall biosynthesis